MSLQDYRVAVDRYTDFQFCIMGKDPYPTDATGVPFCKPDWESMIKDNCSGYHVLNSLGVDLRAYSVEFLRTRYPRPLNLFIHLLGYGVVFTNLSQEFINGVIRKNRHQMQLRDGLQSNMAILEKSDTIILCGEAWKHRWYGQVDESFLNIPHPDIRNRNNPPTSTCWKTWWEKGQLADWLELEIEI